LRRRRAFERPAPRWPSPRDYPKRRPRWRFERRFAATSSKSTTPPRTTPRAPLRTRPRPKIAPTPSIAVWRTHHLEIARALEKSSPRTFDDNAYFDFFSLPSDVSSCTTTVRITIDTSTLTSLASIHRTRRLGPRAERPRLASRRPFSTLSPAVAADVTHPHSSPPATTTRARIPARDGRHSSAKHSSRTSRRAHRANASSRASVVANVPSRTIASTQRSTTHRATRSPPRARCASKPRATMASRRSPLDSRTNATG